MLQPRRNDAAQNVRIDAPDGLVDELPEAQPRSLRRPRRSYEAQRRIILKGRRRLLKQLPMEEHRPALVGLHVSQPRTAELAGRVLQAVLLHPTDAQSAQTPCRDELLSGHSNSCKFLPHSTSRARQPRACCLQCCQRLAPAVLSESCHECFAACSARQKAPQAAATPSRNSVSKAPHMDNIFA